MDANRARHVLKQPEVGTARLRSGVSRFRERRSTISGGTRARRRDAGADGQRGNARALVRHARDRRRRRRRAAPNRRLQHARGRTPRSISTPQFACETPRPGDGASDAFSAKPGGRAKLAHVLATPLRRRAVAEKTGEEARDAPGVTRDGLLGATDPAGRVNAALRAVRACDAYMREHIDEPISLKI